MLTRSRKIIGLFAIAFVISATGCGTTSVKPTTKSTGITSVGGLSEIDLRLYQEAIGSMEKESYSSALKDLKILLTRQPSIKDVWANYVLCLYHLKQTKELNAVLQNVQARSLESAMTMNIRGRLAVDGGEFDSAKGYFSSATELSPSYSNAWYNLALLHDVYLQNPAKAVENYETYLKLVPQDEETKSWVEHLKYTLGE